MRLDGARVKMQVWRPHVRNWGLLEANLLYWRKYLWHCWDFSAPPTVIWCPHSDSASGELRHPCTPRYARGYYTRDIWRFKLVMVIVVNCFHNDVLAEPLTIFQPVQRSTVRKITGLDHQYLNEVGNLTIVLQLLYISENQLQLTTNCSYVVTGCNLGWSGKWSQNFHLRESLSHKQFVNFFHWM